MKLQNKRPFFKTLRRPGTAKYLVYCIPLYPVFHGRHLLISSHSSLHLSTILEFSHFRFRSTITLKGYMLTFNILFAGLSLGYVLGGSGDVSHLFTFTIPISFYQFLLRSLENPPFHLWSWTTFSFSFRLPAVNSSISGGCRCRLSQWNHPDVIRLSRIKNVLSSLQVLVLLIVVFHLGAGIYDSISHVDTSTNS